MDSLLFGDLNEKAGDVHFVKSVSALTEGFSAREKDLLLKNIEIFCEWKRMSPPPTENDP